MSRSAAWITAGVAGLLAIGAATAASAMAATGPSWHIVTSVKSDDTGDFSAVVATGKTTGWAFDGAGFSSPPAAYQLSGTTWKQAAFPGKKNEEVITAGATSPSDVWAFTSGFGTPSRVLHYNGHGWSVVRTFADQIADATVLASNDVWVYGDAPIPSQPVIGVWHYNGSTWKQVSKTIQGGGALSATNAWGFSGSNVEHWTGAAWTATSVRSLLPAKNPDGLNDPQVAGVLALSATNVYAVGTGNAEDEGGPVVVLHYNGSKWAKLAQGQFGNGPGAEFSSDGDGGLWLPMQGPVGGTSYLVHYAAGKLTKATLPVSAPKITVTSLSRVPGSTQQIAGGFIHGSDNRGIDVVAVVLKYS